MSWQDQFLKPEPCREPAGDLTAVGCNIFAGGFAIGVAQHFRVLAHLEESNYFASTFKRNFPRVRTWLNMATWPRERLVGPDLVYCNPPCAPWSTAGVTSRRGGDAWRTDNRVSCVYNSFSVLEALRPKVWIWESVPRAASPGGGRELVLELVKRGAALGYSATELFNAAWLVGVPQRRRRFMLVLHNVELDLPASEPVVRVLKDAVPPPGWCEPDTHWVAPDKVEVYNQTERGGSLRNTHERLYGNAGPRVRGRPPFAEWRMHWDALVGTITSHNAQLHPDEPRYLSLREVHEICAYPSWWEWDGARGTWRTQMAQAVMPLVAEEVARHVAASLRKPRPPAHAHRIVDWTVGRDPASYSFQSVRASRKST